MTGTNSKPIDGIDVSSSNSRQYYQQFKEEQPRAINLFDNAFEWIIEQSKVNPMLSKYFIAMLDTKLPEQVVKLIDSNNGDSSSNDENTDCMKLLICKSAPVIWGMQRAVSQQFTDNEPIENDDNSTTDDTVNTDGRLKAFFQHLPNVEDFKIHGDACDERYSACNIF